MHLNRKKLKIEYRHVALAFLLLTGFVVQFAFSLSEAEKKSAAETTEPSPQIVMPLQFALAEMKDSTVTISTSSTMASDESSSRKTTAIIYSCFIPGAGQTLLGDPYKGAGFTLVAFGSAITALISQNNYVARNERLDALEYQYKVSTNWTNSEYLYQSMIDAHHLLVSDRNRRNIFLAVSAVIWVVNVADVIWNTEDHGQRMFSRNADPLPSIAEQTNMRGVTYTVHQPLVSFSIPLGN
jgi:TM2 domain-containing membrane protein YozV